MKSTAGRAARVHAMTIPSPGAVRRIGTAARLVTLLCAAAPLDPIVGQSTPARPPAAAPAFDKTEAEIPMRDGVRLHTAIYSPSGLTSNVPIILTRTPYGIAGAARTLTSAYAELADDGYIFVFQDIRGRFKSEGQFIMLRPPRDKKAPAAIDESSDTYDTIDWLLKNAPHNSGRVGMLGVSYPGWLTVMAMLDPHPALKAASPQASPADMFIGDDFHHNGAFRLAYGFEYSAAMESGKEIAPFAFDQADSYDWYLKLGSLAHINERYAHEKLPTWNDFAAHPDYDTFWKRQSVTPYLDRVTVPTLNVAGWWDQEDFYGPIKIYETLEAHDTRHLNYLVVGPWNHGGWSGPTGQKLGDVDFGSPTARDFRKNIEAPWFAYWLKDKGKLTLAEATTFETGSNKWQSFDSWPPRAGVKKRSLFFHAGGQLSFEPPAGADTAADAYVSDPASPVPYRKRPIPPMMSAGSGWSTWLANDQRFLKGRMDVVSWTTAPLTRDVVVAGDIAAHLFASTTGTDADWVAKLIDVYPDQGEADPALNGFQFMVANDVLRGRFRGGFDRPVPTVANHVDEYVIDLHSQDYRFRAGHRIMVQVQSTWFPLIDRNPQTFVPNIFAAKDSDFQVATHRIYRSPQRASHVEVSVREGATP